MIRLHHEGSDPDEVSEHEADLLMAGAGLNGAILPVVPVHRGLDDGSVDLLLCTGPTWAAPGVEVRGPHFAASAASFHPIAL